VELVVRSAARDAAAVAEQTIFEHVGAIARVHFRPAARARLVLERFGLVHAGAAKPPARADNMRTNDACYIPPPMTRELEIDVVVKSENERTVRARVPADLRYLEGHFPGQPIVPGIAQLLPLVYETAQRAWSDLPAPTGIKRLKFLEAIRPGDELTVSLVREPNKLRFEIKRGELLATMGTLTF
jgi:3-hydroxyacyl-[acyl-carrier-protein] dehydratase